MEVIARIKFTTPCLGDQRRPDRDLMMRDHAGNVILLQSKWRAALRYAAQARNFYQSEIDNIQVDPVVLGTTGVHKRWYSASAFQEHEAFLTNDEIQVSFCLPNAIPITAFEELLTLAGRYVGVSPYGYKLDFGRFVVLEVGAKKKHAGLTPAQFKSGPGDPGPSGATRPAADVPEANTGR